jgi:hypothetical protein
VGEKALEVSAERESRIFVDCQLDRPAIGSQFDNSGQWLL